MAELAYPARVNARLESHVSRILDEAGVPNFIWGEPVLSILGVPTGIMFSGWVVPDECIEKAAQALDEAKLPPCTQGRDGCAVFWENRAHPYPDHHWHTDLRYPPRLPLPNGADMTCGVFLYRKSRLFWTFPDPPIGRPAADNHYYMLTSDPRIQMINNLTRGRQSDLLYPVKMPIPARYIEAMYLLQLRDREGSFLYGHWRIETGYLTGEVMPHKKNLLLGDINEPFREWARLVIHEQDYDSDYKFELQLYAEMVRNKQLPPMDDLRMDGFVPVEEQMEEYNIPFDPEWVSRQETCANSI